MSQEKKLEGCLRAHLKPGQELPEPPSAEELAKAIQGSSQKTGKIAR